MENGLTVPLAREDGQRHRGGVVLVVAGCSSVPC